MQVEKVLDDLILRLSKSDSTADVRAALIEARRLRNVTMRWAAIPPPPDARREMLTRVMELVAKAGPSAIGDRPLGGAPSTPPPIARERSGAPPPPLRRSAADTPPAPTLDAVLREAARDSDPRVALTPRESRAAKPGTAGLRSPAPAIPPSPASPAPPRANTPPPPSDPPPKFRAEAEGSMTRPRPLPPPLPKVRPSELPVLDEVAPEPRRPTARPTPPPLPHRADAEIEANQRPTAPPPPNHPSAAERFKRKAETLSYGAEQEAEAHAAGLAGPARITPPRRPDSDPPEEMEPAPAAVPGRSRPIPRAHTIAGIAEANEALASIGLKPVPPKRKISSASLDVQQLTSGVSSSHGPVSVKQRSGPPPSASEPPPASARTQRSVTPNPGAPPPLRRAPGKNTLMMGAVSSSDSGETPAAEVDQDLDRALVSASIPRSAPPPPTPPPRKISSPRFPAITPAPSRVSASSMPAVEGFSSAVSQPGMTIARSGPPPNPTIVGTPPPPPPSAPPPRVIAPGEKPLRTVVAPGVTIVRPDASAWQPHPVAPGVTVKLLYRDPRSGVYTALLRLAPGAQLPRRRHVSPEEALLISGIAMLGPHEMRAGEYCRAESETLHEPITTSTGCTFFLCGSEHDEFLEEP